MADDATLTITDGSNSVDMILTKVAHNADKELMIYPIPNEGSDTKTIVVDLQRCKEAVTFNGYFRDVYSGTWNTALDKKTQFKSWVRGTPVKLTFTWGTGDRVQTISGQIMKWDITEVPGRVSADGTGQLEDTTNTSNKIFEVTIAMIRTDDMITMKK
jgi:hypothetical protein